MPDVSGLFGRGFTLLMVVDVKDLIAPGLRRSLPQTTILILRLFGALKGAACSQVVTRVHWQRLGRHCDSLHSQSTHQTQLCCPPQVGAVHFITLSAYVGETSASDQEGLIDGTGLDSEQYNWLLEDLAT